MNSLLSKSLLKGVVIFLSLLIAALLTLTTTGGLKTVIAAINLFSPFKITYDNLHGAILTGHIDATQLSIERSEQKITVEKFILRWQPEALFKQKLLIEQLQFYDPSFNQFGNKNSVVSLNTQIDLAHDNKFIDLNTTWENLPFTDKGQLTVSNGASNNQFAWQLTANYQLDKKKPVQELTGQGNLLYHNNRWHLQQAQVISGKNKLTFAGELAQQLQVTYDLDINDFSALISDITGHLIAVGSISGQPQLRRLNHTATITAKSLNIAEQVQIASSVKVNQTFQKSAYQFHATADSLSLKLPQQGVNLTGKAIQLNSTQIMQLNWQGQLFNQQDPQGQVAFKGSSRFSDAQGLINEVEIKAKNFLAKNTEEIKLTVAGELKIKQQDYEIYTQGKLQIPSARITPKNLDSAVTTSTDVVLVDETKSTSHFNHHLSIHLRIGSDDKNEAVLFEGFNLSSEIVGELAINKQPQALATAMGALALNKTQYTLYGNQLKIIDGKLLYTQSPIDNPNLNLRAIKQVEIVDNSTNSLQLIEPDNETSSGSLQKTRQATITVAISGSVRQPALTLSSTPEMSDSDKLSYLVLGVPSNNLSQAQGRLMFAAAQEMASSLGFNPQSSLLQKLNKWSPVDSINIESTQYIDEETGSSKTQTSLVLDKKINSRLFIRYTIGLINPINILEVQYKLSRRWRVRTQTDSLGQGGGDFIYSIEK